MDPGLSTILWFVFLLAAIGAVAGVVWGAIYNLRADWSRARSKKSCEQSIASGNPESSHNEQITESQRVSSKFEKPEIDAIKREFRYITTEQAISILKVRKGNQESVREGLGEWRTKNPPYKASQSAQPKVAPVAIERKHPASRPTQNFNQANTGRSRSHPPRPGIKERDTRRRIKNRKGKLRSEASIYFRDEGLYQKQRRVTPNCPYCGCVMSAVLTDGVELDHIYPVSRGGENLISNLVFVCKECNQTKSNQGLFEFCSNTGKNINAVLNILVKLGKQV